MFVHEPASLARHYHRMIELSLGVLKSYNMRCKLRTVSIETTGTPLDKIRVHRSMIRRLLYNASPETEGGSNQI